MTRILLYPQTIYEGLYHRISRSRRYHRLGFHWHLIIRQVWAGSPTTISIYYRNDLVMTGKPVREGFLPTDVVGHKFGGHICTRIYGWTQTRRTPFDLHSHFIYTQQVKTTGPVCLEKAHRNIIVSNSLVTPKDRVKYAPGIV